MLNQALINTLNELVLTKTEVAKLLSVDIRTVMRWVDNSAKMTGPAEQTLQAWLRLHRIGMPWRPDGIDSVLSDFDEIAEKIKIYRHNAMQLNTILKKVKERGGPSAPWKVDLKKNVAILGPIKIWFCRLHNGLFSPSTYSRSDCPPDLMRDKTLIEDAFVCIAFAIDNQDKEKIAEQ
jgi:hypothetical protein